MITPINLTGRRLSPSSPLKTPVQNRIGFAKSASGPSSPVVTSSFDLKKLGGPLLGLILLLNGCGAMQSSQAPKIGQENVTTEAVTLDNCKRRLLLPEEIAAARIATERMIDSISAGRGNGWKQAYEEFDPDKNGMDLNEIRLLRDKELEWREHATTTTYRHNHDNAVKGFELLFGPNIDQPAPWFTRISGGQDRISKEQAEKFVEELICGVYDASLIQDVDTETR